MEENLNSLVETVLQQYGLESRSIRLIQKSEKKKKAVWMVAAAEGMLCVKRMPHGLDRTIFSLGAQDYIAKNHGPVPSLFRTKGGELYAEHQGDYFAVYDWLPGRHPLKNGVDDPLSIRAMAAFHRSSRGYQAPEGALVSDKVGDWPAQYRSMCREFSRWIELARESGNGMEEFIPYAEQMIEQGERAIQLLTEHGYDEAVEEFAKCKGLCHQDFGKTNVLIDGATSYVIDFDGITYDFPARDLRKWFNKHAETGWDPSYFERMMEHYEAENPLGETGRVMLYIDLLFPHGFYGDAKKPFKKQEPIDPDFFTDLAEVVRMELDKARWVENQLASR